MRNSLSLLQRTLRLATQDASLAASRTILRPARPLKPRSVATHFSCEISTSASTSSRVGRSTANSNPQQTFSSPLRRHFASVFRRQFTTPSRTSTARPSRAHQLRNFRRNFSSSFRLLFSTAPPQAETSLSARLKKLSREYGWSAFGVYFALSALDFPFCFVAVRWLGTERVGAWEHTIVEWVKKAIPINWPGKVTSKDVGTEVVEEGVEIVDSKAGYDHGVREAELENSGDNASLWTQLALAYAIHKSFIFLRVPATVAVTPKVVRKLRSWGINIGKRTPKAEREAKKAAKAIDEASKKTGP